MRGIRIALVLASLAAAALASAQAATADSLLDEAKSRAKAEQKNVLVLFGASWCGWCKRLNQFMLMPEFKPIFDENFVTVHLTVLENAANLHLENKGAEDIMAWLGGKNAGLPFFAVLSPDGKQLVTSLRPIEGREHGENTGHPVAPEEVAHFLNMMRKGAPRITNEQIAAMSTYLLNQKRG